MSSSLRRSRFRARIPVEDLIAADVEVGSRSSTESSTDPGEHEADLESMTGKGIKRLCSELLELKKASDDDFQRNVYSNYSAFVSRIFEEIGGVESEIVELKKHASTQTKLIQALVNNFYADTVTNGFKKTKVEDLGLSSPSWFGIHMQDVWVTLDILLSEWRLTEALAVLEKETLTLQKLQIEEDRSSPVIMSYTYALSERRTRLAEQLASMAEHPRVSQPELQKALSGLCKLGENQGANSLLLNFYRSRLQKKVHELQCSKTCPYGTNIRELAKVVFSAISQAAKCFVNLYGETSPYSSELILWAREETEAFSHKFHTYVRSISEMNGVLSLAVEAANSTISLCSLLKSQRIFLLSNLMELIRPCMEEVLQMHVDHFRKVVHIFTATDNWTLGKFLSLGIRDKSPVTAIGDKVEYCLLTSSGRKFVTLMQGITDDISPLVNLRMGSSILKGLADLFSEYMHALGRAIPNEGNAIENVSPKVSSAQTLLQQLSLLANASTLVHFFPSIAGSIFKGIKSTTDGLLSEQTETFSQNELESWMLSIEEAANELWCYFCQQFVFKVMFHGEFESTTCVDNWFIPSSTKDPMPSFAFQALFVRLRQLNLLSKSIFVGEDRMMEKLPKEIVERMIVLLSNNQELWTKTVDQTSLWHCSCFEQVHLDMHFLMEIAMLGGYCSNDLIVAAMDLIEEMEVAFTETGSGPHGGVPDGGWAPNAAKLAIEKLLEVEVAIFESEIEPSTTSLKDSRPENWEDNCPSNGKDLIDISESSMVLIDGKTENLDDEDVTRLIEMKDTVSETIEEWTSDDFNDDGSRSSTVPCSDREDEEDGDRANTGTNGPTENEDIRELELERLSIKAEVQSIGSSDDFGDLVAQPIAEELQVILGKENLELENKLLENSILRWQESIEGLGTEVLKSIGSLDGSSVDVLETSKLKKTEGTQELVEEEHTAYPELESVGGLQQHDAIAIASHPLTDELADTAQKENPLVESELLHADRLRDAEGREGVKIGVYTNYPVDKSSKDESNYIMEKGNPLVETALADYNLNMFVSHDSSSRASAEVDSNLSDALRLDLEKKIILLDDSDNSSTMSEELVQVDSSKAKVESTILELQTVEEGDKLLSENLSQLVLSTNPQKQSQDDVIRVQGSGESASGSSVRPRAVVRRRSKTVTHSLERNGKSSNRSDSKISSDVLVKSTVHGLEKKLVIFEDSTRPATVLKELVQVDESKVEGEPALLEHQSIIGEKLPPRISSDLVVERNLQVQGKDTAEARRIVSSDPLLQIGGREQSQGTSNAEKNGKGSDNDEPLKTEEDEKLLSAKFSELALESGLQNQGSDSSNSVGSSGNTSGDPSQQRSGRKRSKSNAEENLVKSGKGAKALRPRWH